MYFDKNANQVDLQDMVQTSTTKHKPHLTYSISAVAQYSVKVLPRNHSVLLIQ